MELMRNKFVVEAVIVAIALAVFALYVVPQYRREFRHKQALRAEIASGVVVQK